MSKPKFNILKMPDDGSDTPEGSVNIGWMYEDDEALMLNLTGDHAHGNAARGALRKYIDLLGNKDPDLCQELENTVNKEDRKAHGGS